MTGFLDEYVHGHFALEEKYMEQFSFPGRSEHVQAHDQFRSSLQDFKALDSAQGELPAESLCYDLFEWFKTHIRTTDKKLGIFLKGKLAV